MKRIYVITLNRIPPSLNKWQNAHWAVKKRIKDDWLEAIGRVSFDYFKGVRHITVLSAIIYFNTKRKRDVDNYNATLWKLTNDALVNLGIIEDDTSDYIETVNPVLIVDKEKAPRTEIVMDVSVKKNGTDLQKDKN